MEFFLLLLALIMMNRRLFETANMRGDVFLRVVDAATGDVVQSFEKKNLIVNNGKLVMARLLGGDASFRNLEHLSKIAFGTSNTAAAATQTTLVSEAFEKTASVSYPAFNQVRFSVTMEANEGGSLQYQELGLKSNATEFLFSRLVISPITKSTLYKIQVEWTISIQ